MTNKIIKAGVIGDPIAHSLSPIIHNFLLKKYDISGSYEAIHVKKNDLKSKINYLINNDFVGFNVTIPHKEEIFLMCDYLSNSARAIGAVNTVIITHDKKIFGHNSDSDGFINNLKFNVPDFNLKSKQVFLVGAGGASRAIIYGLIKSSVAKIFIYNRDQQRANNLIKHFCDFANKNNCQLNVLDKKSFDDNLKNCDLLVNSSSLGMEGQDPLMIDLSKLKKTALVYDIVYKPLITDLLNQASKNGNKIITGLGMLINQALIGFEAWYKKKPENDQQLEKILLKNLKL